MKYVDRYNREHYRRLWVRRETFERLSKVCDKPIVDCIDEIVGLVDLPDRVFSKVKEYLLNNTNPSKHLRYAGGDWYIKDDLIDIAVRVPPKKATFVEVFGGSGVLSQFVPRSKFSNVIYNDIDKDLVSLHELLKRDPDLLASVLTLLPYSRYINSYIAENLGGKEFGGLVGAAILFYALATGISGMANVGFSASKTPSVSSARRYVSNVAAIYDVAARFRDITIECLDFEALIKKYDSPETLFYLDPPYVSVSADRSNYYRHGFNEAEAMRLARVIRTIKGFYMLKIHEDNLRYYGSLQPVSKVSMVMSSYMHVTQDEERRTFRYVILTNYKLGGLPAKSAGRA